MTDLAQYTVDAVSAGSTYVLLGLGLTLVFSVMGLINFAYGTLIVWGGYTIAELSAHGVGMVPSLIAMVLVVIVLSVAMAQVAFRPFRNAPPATLLLTSFGVLLVMQAIAITAFGDTSLVLVPTPEFLSQGFSVGSVRVTWLAVANVIGMLSVLAGLELILTKSRLGLQLRAVAEDSDVAQLLGVRSDRVLLVAFAISGVATAVAAFLWLAKTGTVSPRADLAPTLKAFIVVVIGGLGTIRGAVVGGLLLGVFETLLTAYLPESLTNYQLTFVFVILTVILVFRPQGLLGRQVEISK